MFEEITGQQHSGKIVARLTPPRGYNAAGESGLVAFEGPDGKSQQLPFGLQDLQVLLQPHLSCYIHRCVTSRATPLTPQITCYNCRQILQVLNPSHSGAHQHMSLTFAEKLCPVQLDRNAA